MTKIAWRLDDILNIVKGMSYLRTVLIHESRKHEERQIYTLGSRYRYIFPLYWIHYRYKIYPYMPRYRYKCIDKEARVNVWINVSF